MSWFRIKERLRAAAENGKSESLLKECVCQKVNLRSGDGLTALYVASQNGHLEVVQHLVRAGKADIEAKSIDECTALHIASQNGYLEVVRSRPPHQIWCISLMVRKWNPGDKATI